MSWLDEAENARKNAKRTKGEQHKAEQDKRFEICQKLWKSHQKALGAIASEISKKCFGTGFFGIAKVPITKHPPDPKDATILGGYYQAQQMAGTDYRLLVGVSTFGKFYISLEIAGGRVAKEHLSSPNIEELKSNFASQWANHQFDAFIIRK